MDFDTLLRGVDSIEKLKCKLCNNFLSYFPIHTSADNRSTCGRCPKTDDQHRSEAYEALAQFIQFPCQFEGCKERILPKDMPHHVQVCPYKIINCPTFKYTECTWKGAFWTALQHCRDQHSNLFLEKNEFEIDLERSHQAENLIEFNGTLFIVWRKFDLTNNLFQYAIYHIEDEINLENIPCILKVTNCKRDIVDKCSATSYNEQEIGEITLDMLKFHNNSTVLGIITSDIQVVSVEEKVNEEMLFHLKCSLCFTYALPPIYHDKDNKVTCYECANEGVSRNYNLDNIASLLNYSCKYLKNGCTLVLKAEEMKKHQTFCSYGSDHCPVNEYTKCKWFGLRKDVTGHLQEHHQAMIRDNYCEISEEFNFTVGVTKCYILKVGDIFFKLFFTVGVCSFDGKSIFQDHKWSLQTICQHEKNLIYEIEIVDCNGLGRNLTAKQLCQPPMKDSELFLTDQKFCSFTYYQIFPLLSVKYCNRSVTFKVSV